MDILKELPELLLPWFETNKRDLPWRQDREPYHVWLSEIMLQQTRVEAVKGYYARFLEACPDIGALAACEDERLHKLWEGLGYYSRVRNLKKAAQKIMQEHGGSFPAEYGAIHALPGIGDYTAGAICSICFEQPRPAVDGNVLRVMSRLTGDGSPVTEQKTKDNWSKRLAVVYPAGSCGEFTQALMELGATVCLPNRAPLCETCPLKGICRSREQELWRSLPVKAPKKARRIEEMTVFILRCGGDYILHKRAEEGLLAGLWELPHTEGKLSLQEGLDNCAAAGFGRCLPEKSVERKHIFTHIEWRIRGYYFICEAVPEGYLKVSPQELAEVYSLPTAFRQFVEDREPGTDKA